MENQKPDYQLVECRLSTNEEKWFDEKQSLGLISLKIAKFNAPRLCEFIRIQIYRNFN
jgi:hypothetical protein